VAGGLEDKDLIDLEGLFNLSSSFLTAFAQER